MSAILNSLRATSSAFFSRVAAGKPRLKPLNPVAALPFHHDESFHTTESRPRAYTYVSLISQRRFLSSLPSQGDQVNGNQNTTIRGWFNAIFKNVTIVLGGGGFFFSSCREL